MKNSLIQLNEYDIAKDEGNFIVLDEATALAMMAGARAILKNKRIEGTTYVYDVFGEHKTISYYEAAMMLRDIAEAALARQREGGNE